MDICSSPPIYLVDNSQDILAGEAMVDWSQPIFHDNSLKDVNVTRTIWIRGQILDPSEILEDGPTTITTFPIGSTNRIEYVATDISGNRAVCVLNITLQGE